MATLVFKGDAIFGVPAAASVQGPSEHYTIVFNAFVMMQLFNQVGGWGLLPSLCWLFMLDAGSIEVRPAKEWMHWS